MGLVIKKQNPPLILTHKNYKIGERMGLFVWGFLKRKRDFFSRVFDFFFSDFAFIYSFFLLFLTQSYINFLPLFLVSPLMIFPRVRGEGSLQQNMKEQEANIGVPWYTSATHPFEGVGSIGVAWYTNASSILIRCVSALLAFFVFFSTYGLTFIRLFRGLSKLFSPDFICMESFGCLVSNGPILARFGATVIEILHLEGR